MLYSLAQEDYLILYSFGSWDGLCKINLQLYQLCQIPEIGGDAPSKMISI
jgi:hypothetical protein